MIQTTDPDDVILSASILVEEVREYHDWGRQMDELREKRKARRERFALVAQLIGPEKAAAILGDLGVPETTEDAPSARGSRTDNATWTGFIETYVQSVDRPVDYAELREAVSKSVLGPRLEKSDKGFYGALGKLIDKGTIARERGWVFSIAAFNDYKRKLAAGEIEELPPSSSQQPVRGSKLGDEIKRFLDARPHGATGREIIDHVVQFDEFRGPVERNSTSVYNVLSRMVKRDEIQKEGTRYYPLIRGWSEDSGIPLGAAI